MAVLAAYFAYEQNTGGEQQVEVAGSPQVALPAADWRSGQQVQSQGTVIRVLSDDNTGSRHQRFILQHGSGRTLLIAHNIDVAPRIESLREGDTVAFHGQYEWNDKGGVIHWTHHDPQGRHVGGWLEYNGRRYQ